MKKPAGVLNDLFLRADLGSEPVPGMPLVELMNDCRVLIENHRGVTSYGCHEIRIRLGYGVLSVYGQKLEIACMSKNQIVIIGSIDGISLHRGIGR